MMLRVMTTNLLRGRADASALADLLDVWDPDIVAAQELGYTQTDVLEHRFGFGVCKPDGDGEGKGLVARIPMTVDILELPDRDAMRGVADTWLGDVEVIGLHLLNPLDAWLRRAPSRRRQLAALLEHLTPDRDHRVVMGDMNASPLWPAYRQIRKVCPDVVADWAHGGGMGAAPTWSPGPSGRAVLRIDHVFASGLRARRVHVSPMPGSDHRVIIVDLDAV